jgi:hypothetical protein
VSERSVAELIREVAHAHGDIASPKALAPFVLDALRGQEAQVLERLLPAYIGSLLRRRTPGDGHEWEDFLVERISTDHGVVFGREATSDDLHRGAERRRTFAGRLDQRALQYDGIADAMTAEHVSRAGDLSAVGQSAAHLRTQLAILRLERRRNEKRAHSVLDVLKTAVGSFERAAQEGRNIYAEQSRASMERLRHYRDGCLGDLEKGRAVDRRIAEKLAEESDG